MVGTPAMPVYLLDGENPPFLMPVSPFSEKSMRMESGRF
jgi:hypothetical protein